MAETYRLGQLNLSLHGIEARWLHGDTLGDTGVSLESADLVLSNPPFGNRRGSGPPARGDLPVRSANKALCFLQHVDASLAPGGRAAVVVPDQLLSAGGAIGRVRRSLLERRRVHTLLRLPLGIFYAPGIRASVVFFDNAPRDHQLWVHDLRTGVEPFGKRRRLEREHFAPFEAGYRERRAGERSLLVDLRGVEDLDHFIDPPGARAAGDLESLHAELRVQLEGALSDLDALHELMRQP